MDKGNRQGKARYSVKNVRGAEVPAKQAKAAEMGQQGAWKKWEVQQQNVSCAKIYRLEPLIIYFMLISVYDLLPSPTKLTEWGLTEDLEFSHLPLRIAIRILQ